MKFDKFTLKAQEALATAQQTAMAQSHTTLTPLHLLHALCTDEAGMVPDIFKKIGANVARIQDMANSELERLPTGHTSGQLIMPDPELGQLVLDAQNRADKMGDEYLSVEHLLLSLSVYKSTAREILELNAISTEQIENALQQIRGDEKVTGQTPEDKYRALERYGGQELELSHRGPGGGRCAPREGLEPGGQALQLPLV